MPDSDNPSSSGGGASYEPRNLPVPIEVKRENGEGWLTRMFRSLFGRKPETIRADLRDVLDAMTPGEIRLLAGRKRGCSRTSSACASAASAT